MPLSSNIRAKVGLAVGDSAVGKQLCDAIDALEVRVALLEHKPATAPVAEPEPVAEPQTKRPVRRSTDN